MASKTSSPWLKKFTNKFEVHIIFTRKEIAFFFFQAFKHVKIILSLREEGET